MASPYPTSDDGSQFGALIRSHRLRIGLTQRELADLSTISMRAIRNLEQGRALRPRPDTIRLIADALRLGDRARTALESAARRRHFAADAPADLAVRPPAPPTALHPVLGREAETEVLVSELSTGAERLVNLVGLSGVGKSWLALEAANRLYGAGLPVLWFAFPGTAPGSLSSMQSGLTELVDDAVAELYGGTGVAVGVVAGVVAGTGTGDGFGPLVDLLGEQAALLVLDGAPAAAPRSDRLHRLLHECPGLRLLVTGDQPWGVPGERTFMVGPLEVPTMDAVSGPRTADTAAVRVFLSHVRRVIAEFVPTASDLAQVGEICRRLDGHPTALASAASWLMVYDLPTLRDCAGSDPAALLDHLAGGDGGQCLCRALHRVLCRLPAGHRALLTELCTVPEGLFDLAAVVALTGRTPIECGRMVRDLLIHGVIRPNDESGRSQFQVLHLVRALHPAAAAAADGSAGGLLAAAAG